MYERNINFYQVPGKPTIMIMRYFFRFLRLLPLLITLYAILSIIRFHTHDFLYIGISAAYVFGFVTFLTFDKDYLFGYEPISKDKELIILDFSRKDKELNIFCNRIIHERPFIQKEWLMAEQQILTRNLMPTCIAKRYVQYLKTPKKESNVIQFKKK